MGALLAALLVAATPPSVFVRFECHRCHEGTGLSAPSPDKQCVGCHQRILGGRFEGARPETVTRWQSKIKGLVDAPSLADSKRRLKKSWVRNFLARPEKIRPDLPASMPRLPLSEAELQALAEALGGEDDAGFAASSESIDAGRALYATLGCGQCHRFSGAGVDRSRDSRAAGVIMAPDLALSRERLRPSSLVPMMIDPTTLRRNTPMPSFGLTEQQAQNLAAFVLLAPLKPKPEPTVPKRLGLLERTVDYSEVEARVFKKVCWHCHSNPAYANGDGGPGNTGGFGYRARGLDLSSYEGIMKGSLGDDGRRRSVFTALEDGTPRLVAHLVARQREQAGEASELTGMPLGFPALSAEEIQLVESWIAQGRRR